MAYVNANPSVSDSKKFLKSNPQHWNNLNLLASCDAIRILLFKECMLRDRQLIFDSHSNQNVDNDKSDSSKGDKKHADEFSHLTEMIFGSTAMKYQDTYYKIHDVSCPDRIIFTQVFSTPYIRKLQGNIESSFSKSNSNFQHSTSTLGYDSSNNSLSQSSMDFKSNSFSIFRKNNWISPNSTSATIDSGYSDSSFSSNSSFQPSFGSFTRRERLKSTTTSMDIYNCFINSSSSRNLSSNGNYSRLGLALIIPARSYGNKQENICLQHITFIESILWRIRQYIELALNSPRIFLTMMYDISSMSVNWLSKEMNYWTNKCCVKNITGNTGGIYEMFKKTINVLNLRKLIFKQETKDERFESFCQTLNELDVKETKFFLSSLLTAVLTHHTGWVATCYQLQELTLNDSYHAIWRQLTNLYGASGYLAKTSRTVIYGLKSHEVIKKVIDFLPYFIRYFRVQRCFIERVNIFEENQIVDNICNSINQRGLQTKFTPPILKQGLTKIKKMNTNLSDLANINENRDFLTNVIENQSGASNFPKKGLSKMKTFNCGLNDLNEGCDFGSNNEINEKPVLFILGDDDKLQNLKKSSDENNDFTEKTENKEVQNSTKLKVIKFPLPKVKSLGDISEVIPYDFLPDNGFEENYVPDKIFQGTSDPEKKWKNTLKNELSFKRSCLFSNQIEENVAILGNTDKWEVQLWSSTRNRMTRDGSDRIVDASPLVSNMLEAVLEMWKLNMSKDQCMTFMEQRLVEICLKANALSQFLLTTNFCTMETVLSKLKLNITDVPLLMSVGSNINPEILQKYGISYQ